MALIPLAAFAAIALGRIQVAVTQDADARAQDALRSVSAILDNRGTDLYRSTDSYATWDVLRAQVAALQLSDIESEVFDFQLDSGAVDAAVLRVGSERLSGGPSDLTEALDTEVGRRVDRPSSLESAALARLGDALYLVAVRPVDLSGQSGPGVEAARQGGTWLAFAQRLGPRFALDAHRLTGFDLAIYGPQGDLLVATDADLAKRLRPLSPSGATSTTEVGPAAALGALGPLRDPQGAFLGSVAVMTDLGVIGAVDQALLPLLLVAFALALLLALVLAIVLAGRLRARVRDVEHGLAAAAAGSPSAPLPVEGQDVLAQLATSHNRLAAALERREGILRASEAALTGLIPERGPEAIQADGLAAVQEVFGLRAARLADATGEGLADATGEGPADATGEGPAEGPVRVPCPVGDRLLWLVAEREDAWSEADQAQLTQFCRQLGAALEGAERYAVAASRAVELDRLNRLQADFLRGVSHNLQTPLTRILAVSDDLREADPGKAPVGEQLDVIGTEGRRLARLVGQLLTFSRLEAGAFRPEEELVAIPPLARRAWDGVADPRPLDVVDAGQGALVVADRAAVEQILWILLDNASRYAPGGPVTVRIGPPQDRAIEIRVEDHGPGIPAGEEEHVFERFVRGSSGEAHGGTGLGLGVARGLAEALGGSLSLAATAAAGAVFVLRLPAEAPIAEP